jgi:hypothetical protein
VDPVIQFGVIVVAVRLEAFLHQRVVDAQRRTVHHRIFGEPGIFRDPRLRLGAWLRLLRLLRRPVLAGRRGPAVLAGLRPRGLAGLPGFELARLEAMIGQLLLDRVHLVRVAGLVRLLVLTL